MPVSHFHMRDGSNALSSERTAHSPQLDIDWRGECTVALGHSTSPCTPDRSILWCAQALFWTRCSEKGSLVRSFLPFKCRLICLQWLIMRTNRQYLAWTKVRIKFLILASFSISQTIFYSTNLNLIDYQWQCESFYSLHNHIRPNKVPLSQTTYSFERFFSFSKASQASFFPGCLFMQWWPNFAICWTH